MREEVTRVPDNYPRKGEEIIRCRDCKWLKVVNAKHLVCMFRFNRTIRDAFCSWGEKKNDRHS